MHAGSDDPTKLRGRKSAGARLLVYWDGGSAEHALGPGARLVVGRADDCEVRVRHESVSRRHARFATDGGAWRVEDLGSANGTIVGGVALRKGQSRVVDAGTVVVLGDARAVVDAPSDARSGARRGPLEGIDEPMERVLRMVELVADSTMPVLLLGETGVGKGRLAAQIHERSSRARGPFVRVNCAAVAETLLESELFGHERGAFTGAVQSKPGLLETADGGTVFLDEIGDVSLATQAKLLHAIEDGQVLRVGGVRPHAIDVRFVAATNRDVEAMLASGQFRRDLYFRLAGVPLRVPPLRERTSEIPAMTRAFVEEACAQTRRSAPSIATDTMVRLATYSWPGNIRELRNVVMRATLLCTGSVLLPEHLMLDASAPPDEAAALQRADAPRRLESEMRDFERKRIVDALERFDGHQGKAADYLGVSRRTLTNKLNELDLPRPRKGRSRED